MSIVINKTGIVDKERWENASPKICFILNNLCEIDTSEVIKPYFRDKITSKNFIPTCAKGLKNVTETIIPDAQIDSLEEQEEVIKDLAFIFLNSDNELKEDFNIKKEKEVINYIKRYIAEFEPDIIFLGCSISTFVTNMEAIKNDEKSIPMQVRDALKKDGFFIIDNKVIIKKDIGFGVDYSDIFRLTCQAYQNALHELKIKEKGDEA